MVEDRVRRDTGLAELNRGMEFVIGLAARRPAGVDGRDHPATVGFIDTDQAAAR
jgi:hypothetical protein